MDQESNRLSAIKTLWTQMFRPGKSDDPSDGPPRDLVLRYYGAVFRYLLGIVRDEDVAMELTQEFAGRFLRGDFKKASPERGRFRDFLKASLRNLVIDHYRKVKVAREKGPQQMPEEEPGDNSQEQARDEAFVISFREEVLARTWEALSEVERTTGKPYHTVLRFKIQRPDLSSGDMAGELTRQLGKVMTDVATRQTLHRARSQFADLLLEEVCRTLGTPSEDELTQELGELRLLDYCKSALERRTKQGEAGA